MSEPEKEKRFTSNGLPIVPQHQTGWEDEFLKSFANTGNITLSSNFVGVDPRVIRRRRLSDPEFEERFKEAQQQAVELLEAAAWQRARHGVKRTKGIYHNGRRIAEETFTEYSDGLLTFLLKANAPGKYRETVNHQHSIDIARELVKSMVEQDPSISEAEVMAEFNRIMGLD